MSRRRKSPTPPRLQLPQSCHPLRSGMDDQFQRLCLGRRLAWGHALLVLAHLVRLCRRKRAKSRRRRPQNPHLYHPLASQPRSKCLQLLQPITQRRLEWELRFPAPDPPALLNEGAESHRPCPLRLHPHHRLRSKSRLWQRRLIEQRRLEWDHPLVRGQGPKGRS